MRYLLLAGPIAELILGVRIGLGAGRRALLLALGIPLALITGAAIAPNHAVSGSEDVTVRGAFLISAILSLISLGLAVALGFLGRLVRRR